MTLGTHTDHTARNMSLDASYGANKGSAWPASVNLRLYNGDPSATVPGTELSAAGGYGPVSVANSGTNFPAAATSKKSNGVDVSFAASGGAWSSGATYWAFESGGVIYDSGQIVDPTTGVPMTLTVSAAGVIVRFAAGKLTITVPTP